MRSNLPWIVIYRLSTIILDDRVHPIYDPTDVFECKYELDSLASFLKLSWLYYERTKELNFVTPTWLKAITLVLRVIDEQSEPTFDPVIGEAKVPHYHVSKEYEYWH